MDTANFYFCHCRFLCACVNISWQPSKHVTKLVGRHHIYDVTAPYEMWVRSDKEVNCNVAKTLHYKKLATDILLSQSKTNKGEYFCTVFGGKKTKNIHMSNQGF